MTASKESKGMYRWKRAKILVEPIRGIDYSTRLQARLAWDAGTPFVRVGIDGDGKMVDRIFAADPKNKIGEVTIQFAKGTQAIVVKIPALSKDVIAQLAAQE